MGRKKEKEKMALWMHRPTIAEHEELRTAMKEGDYPSVSAFVREATLRLIYAEDKRPMFSRLQTLVEQAGELVDSILEEMKEGSEDE